ncbi:hypothetical protein O6H91_07G093900 [Diphasiastrum complanatum]|uniref:Uncharacterized protein n=2 Tax=Diphasiastrum complanatum TaxID=34168 RepID=A0ACC2D7P9_DIPCM|nr:hypothetical protein O6H91_07G080500 [Diphasiastrum complanatum]KAJ7550302.1 hypothetical protein O6H91_07G093900 [Diphasiastrum complanatum]
MKSSDIDKDSKATSLSDQTSIFSQERLNLDSLQTELSLDQSTISEQSKSKRLIFSFIVWFMRRACIDGCNYKCIKTMQGLAGRIFSLYLYQASLYSSTDRTLKITPYNALLKRK